MTKGSTVVTFSSIEEADEHRLACLEEIQEIERQLADRAAATRPNGAFIAPKEYAEYREWRKRAIAARFHLLNEMRDAKEYIRAQRYSAAGNTNDVIEKLVGTLQDAMSLVQALRDRMGDTEAVRKQTEEQAAD